MNEIKHTSNQQELIEFDQIGYTPVDEMREDRKELLSMSPDRTMRMIHDYYFGTRFNHDEAYDLCAVGLSWPDFCYHSTNKYFILAYSKLNSTDSDTNLTDLHKRFETYVDTNRKMIAKKAAESLSLSWEEIEAAK
ncbi:MAG: hypothetical protein ABI758_05775 [Candidatus Woesebacteria bacterium]